MLWCTMVHCMHIYTNIQAGYNTCLCRHTHKIQTCSNKYTHMIQYTVHTIRQGIVHCKHIFTDMRTGYSTKNTCLDRYIIVQFAAKERCPAIFLEGPFCHSEKIRNLIGCCKPGAGAFGSAECLRILASDWSEHWRWRTTSIPRQPIRRCGRHGKN